MATRITAKKSELAPTGPMLRQQTRAELLRLWRNPSFLIPTLILPVLLYAIIGGLGTGHVQGVSRQVYAVTSVGTYCIISIMLVSFGVSVAAERGQRVNVLTRATPLPVVVYLLAKVIITMLSALVMLSLLCILAAQAGGVQLDISAWLTFIVSLLLGVLPFILLGFALGYLCSPTSAGGLINISFLVLAFASGIFIPLADLPQIVQNIAPYTPFYRLDELAMHAVGMQTDSLFEAIWQLAVYVVIFWGLAFYAYRREEQQSFG